jgi:hypothetical protein
MRIQLALLGDVLLVPALLRSRQRLAWALAIVAVVASCRQVIGFDPGTLGVVCTDPVTQNAIDCPDGGGGGPASCKTPSDCQQGNECEAASCIGGTCGLVAAIDGTVCGSTGKCANGKCACLGNETNCAGMCTDTTTDPANCGACGSACTTGAICSGGSCACKAGLSMCSSACVDTATEAKNCGACGHDCLGGTCSASLCEPVVLSSSGQVRAIAVDASNVYWTDGLGVSQVPIAGGNPVALAGSPANPGGIGVDASYVYWTDSVSAAVHKVPIGGGTDTVLASGTSGLPDNLALDDTSVYWTETKLGGLSKVLKSGGMITTLASGGSEEFVGIAVDASNAYFAGSLGVAKIPKNGGTATFLSGQNAVVSGNNVAIDTTSIYWVSSGGVFKASISGGVVTTLTNTLTNAVCIAVDGANLYVGGPGGLWRIPTGGGTPMQLASATVLAVQTDATYIFVGTDSSVMRLAK